MAITLWDLKQCHALCLEAEDTMERRAHAQAMAEGISGSIGGDESGVRGGGAGGDNRIVNAICAMDEYSQVLTSQALAYFENAKYVVMAIEEIPCSDWRRVLKLRYVDGLLWEEVCRIMHISFATCKRYHNKGLKALSICEGMLPEEADTASNNDATNGL